MKKRLLGAVFLLAMFCACGTMPGVVIVSDRSVKERLSHSRGSPHRTWAQVGLYWVKAGSRLVEILPTKGYTNIIQGPTAGLMIKVEVKNSRHHQLTINKNVFLDGEPFQFEDYVIGNTAFSSHVLDLPHQKNGAYHVRIVVRDEKRGKDIAVFENIKYIINKN